MMETDLRHRLARLIGDHIPEDSDLTPSGEISAIMAMPPSVREEVVNRLEAIDRFQANPGSAQAEAEATRLGMKRRNFYYLVARLRIEGPVRALSPAKAGYRRVSNLMGELGDIVANVIADTLQKNPECSSSSVITAVAQECALHGIKPPSDRTIRTRLSNARMKPEPGIALGDGLLGREIFIDQTAAAFLVEKGGTEQLGLVTMFVDVGTRLILAIGAGVSFDPISGLEGALKDWEERRSKIPTQQFVAQHWPDSVHWIVPDDLRDDVMAWVSTATANDVSGLASGQGVRRHGSRLLRSIGSGLGWVRFLPRRTGLREQPAADNPGFPRLSERAAQEAVSSLADEWNAKIASEASPVPKIPHEFDATGRHVGVSQRLPYGLDWVFHSVRITLDHHKNWQSMARRRKEGGLSRKSHRGLP